MILYLYAMSIILLLSGLILAFLQPKKFILLTIITAILSPLPAIYYLYSVSGFTASFQLVLIGYIILVLSITIPPTYGYIPKSFNKLYIRLRKYYINWLVNYGSIEYVNAPNLAKQLSIYTYLILIFAPVVSLPLFLLGYYIYGICLLYTSPSPRDRG